MQCAGITVANVVQQSVCTYRSYSIIIKAHGFFKKNLSLGGKLVLKLGCVL